MTQGLTNKNRGNKLASPGKSLRQRALDHLARREYSRQELQHKLQPLAGEDDDLPALLDDFQKHGWLSNERFAEQVVHARNGRYGSLKVAHELREKGLDDALVSKAVAQMTESDEANARSIWKRKFSILPKDRHEWAKQARFLQSRGFSFDTIKRVLNTNLDDET